MERKGNNKQTNPPSIGDPRQGGEVAESLRRSNRQRGPPTRFTDYVTIIIKDIWRYEYDKYITG